MATTLVDSSGLRHRHAGRTSLRRMALTARRRLVQLQGQQQAESDHFWAPAEHLKRACCSSLDLDFVPVVSSHTQKGSIRKKTRLPFAAMSGSSIATTCSGTEKPNGRQRKPQAHFVVASSTGSSTQALGVPHWRIALGNIAAGATAGATVEAALYPIDTIKTRLQATISGGGVRALLQSGGGKALYAGLWGNLAGVVPASAIFMGIYEPVKQHIARRVPENRNYLAALGGGALAGLAASIVRVPTEVVKQRLQTGEFRGALQAISSITKAEGVRGLFAGYGSFLLRDLPFDAIEFVAYEQLKRSYKASLTEAREPNSLETSAIGAIAGAFTGVVTTPLDVIKTRLMTQGTAKTYSGVFDCAHKIWTLEGSSAFLKGWQPRVIWIGLGGCVFFTALEKAKVLYLPEAALQQQNSHSDPISKIEEM